MKTDKTNELPEAITNSKPLDFSKLTISQQTQAFLTCIHRLCELREAIYQTLELTYAGDSSEEIYNKDYYDKIDALEQQIFEGMRPIISVNFSRLNITEI